MSQCDRAAGAPATASLATWSTPGCPSAPTQGPSSRASFDASGAVGPTDREHDGDAGVDLLVGLDLRQATEGEVHVLGVEELEDVAPDSLLGRQAHEAGRGPARVVDDPGPIDEHERHGGAIDE